MIKKLNSQILFQRLQMRASLFSVVRRKWLLFVVENYVLISKIIYRFHVHGNLLSQVHRVAAFLFSVPCAVVPRLSTPREACFCGCVTRAVLPPEWPVL